MRVLIVAKTRMTTGFCIGALALDTKRSLCLQLSGTRNQLWKTDYEVGQVWDMAVQPVHCPRLPHIEDAVVTARHLGAQLFHLQPLPLRQIRPWTGDLGYTIGGCLDFTTEGSGYIGARAIPPMSTGFWLVDKPLRRFLKDDQVRYAYPGRYGPCALPYVGLDEPLDLIPPGTSTRLSLARWWPP